MNTSELDFMLVNAVKDLAEQNRQQGELIEALPEQNKRPEETITSLVSANNPQKVVEQPGIKQVSRTTELSRNG